MYYVEKSHQHSCSCVCVHAGVRRVCVCVCVCVSTCGKERASTSLMYVNSNKLLHLSESPEVPLVSFLVLAMYASFSSI